MSARYHKTIVRVQRGLNVIDLFVIIFSVQSFPRKIKYIPKVKLSFVDIRYVLDYITNEVCV